MSVRLLPCGERAFLVELADLDAVLALDALVRQAVARQPVARHIEDVVPAARTLLVTVDGPDALVPVRSLVSHLALGAEDAGPRAVSDAEEIEIRVVYDGPDLEEVGSLTGLSAAGVVQAHTATPWRVAFGGFAPGFAYLVGGDPRLEVPRRAEPRTAVPPGAVALASTFSAVYPRQSPGGWQIIGHTDQVLWDSDRRPPALLRPGMVVRFAEEAGRA